MIDISLGHCLPLGIEKDYLFILYCVFTCHVNPVYKTQMNRVYSLSFNSRAVLREVATNGGGHLLIPSHLSLKTSSLIFLILFKFAYQ